MGTFIIGFLILFCLNVEAAKTPLEEFESKVPPRIRVRLQDDTKQVEVRGLDLRIYELLTYSDQKPHWRTVALPASMSQWSFHCQNSKIQVQEYKEGGVKGTSFVLRNPIRIKSPTGFLSIQSRPYREEVRIYSYENRCEVINVVDLEKYLDGLVNAEFSSQWDQAAVAAQVIVARTYAYYKMNEVKKNPYSTFDLDATTKDQVYDGFMREDFKASRVVEMTRGIVLTLKNSQKKLIKAFYHSTCGGITELPGPVWGLSAEGYNRRIYCPFCKSSPRFYWETEFYTKEIEDAIRKGVAQGNVPANWPKNWKEVFKNGELVQLNIQKDQLSQRVSWIKTIWRVPEHEKGQVTLPIRGALFRSWIGPIKLRSTAFEVVEILRSNSQKFKFSGRGNGHGVGMCQWGAKTMGEKGYRVSSILSYYYPTAVTRKMW